jgi:Glucodextranase, domain B/PASTA domain
LPRLWIAAIIAAIAALGVVPAAAQATVTATNITSWTSDSSGTPPNSPYLISYDNQPTRMVVTGTAPGAVTTDRVDIVCYSGASSQFKTLATNLAVHTGGTFTTSTGNSAPALSQIAGRACRLRAVPHNGAGTGDRSVFAGPNLAISETALLPTISGGPNNGAPYNFYVNGVTFTGTAAWKAPGTPAAPGAGACGGPYAAPVDPAFDVGNFPIDCVGSLFGDDLGTFGGRSEVVIDGRNAYDPAAAQGLIARTGGLDNGSQDLAGFPDSPDKSLKVSVDLDPRSGQISSTLTEFFVFCHGTDPYKPITTVACPSFDDTGVKLTRVTTTSDGGRVITLTDTWSSTDGQSHSLDLLYDDYAGVAGNADGERGWQFPGQTGYTQYAADAPGPAPGSSPASILLRTNISAPDGDPNEGYGAISYGHAPAGFRFAGPSELEEDQLLTVPAGGTASLSYVYSIAATQADINSLAMAAQDRFQPAVVQIVSPAEGTTVSSPSVTLSGTAAAGSGIKSLVVGGQSVPVAADGTWSTQVPLGSGANTITALATDGAGATPQDQVTVVYQPPASAPPPPAPVVAKCHVPRLKGKKLPAAEKALRKAHCRVGKIKHVSSRKLARGRVMSTKPRPGRRLRSGSKIEVFVSKGR